MLTAQTTTAGRNCNIDTSSSCSNCRCSKHLSLSNTNYNAEKQMCSEVTYSATAVYGKICVFYGYPDLLLN